ncbi:MAG TPA: ABC transporter substrate-binding protein, partial [Trueperaceae bacterium]|nr:ABC transporter substrate-binding protein [Trueperaceae bacterium]
VAHAVDRQALVDAFYGENATAAKDIIPTALWGHTDDEGYAYDPELSRQLLADAGFPNGFDTALWYRNTGIAQTIAEVVATYLADVGIRASVNTEDWAAYLADYMAGNFPMYMLGWNADFADPDTFIYTFYGPQAVPRFGWVRPDVVELAAAAREVPTQAEREALYAQVLAAAAEDAPMLPLTHESPFLTARTNVTGLLLNPLGGFPPLTGVSKTQ